MNKGLKIEEINQHIEKRSQGKTPGADFPTNEHLNTVVLSLLKSYVLYLIQFKETNTSMNLKCLGFLFLKMTMLLYLALF